jgi:hypothetical protein
MTDIPTGSTTAVDPDATVTSTPPSQGPLNLFNERVHSADAFNRAYDTKVKYDQLGAPALESHWVSPPSSGTPISPGRPVVLDDNSRYMIDMSIAGGQSRR